MNRKIRKLKNNPKLFFKDMYLKRAVKKKVPVLHEEPRVIGFLDMEASPIFKYKDMVVRNQRYSTLFLVDCTVGRLGNAPLLGELLRNKNDFIGFREKFLFALRVVERGNIFLRNYESISNDKSWYDGKLSEFRNVILFDDYIKYAGLIRSSNVRVRIIAVVDHSPGGVEPAYNDIDHLICHKKNCSKIKFRKDVSYFNDTKELVLKLEQIITQAGEKSYDYFVPVSGKVEYLSDIDELNAGPYDIVVNLHTHDLELSLRVENFSEYVEKLSENMEYLLMRESWMQRYASLVSCGDKALLLKCAIRDGARVRVF